MESHGAETPRRTHLNDSWGKRSHGHLERASGGAETQAPRCVPCIGPWSSLKSHRLPAPFHPGKPVETSRCQSLPSSLLCNACSSLALLFLKPASLPIACFLLVSPDLNKATLEHSVTLRCTHGMATFSRINFNPRGEVLTRGMSKMAKFHRGILADSLAQVSSSFKG